MKNKKIIQTGFILFILLTSFVIFSFINYTPTPILAESKSCICSNDNDPLAKPLVFTYGKFAGRCVNNCTRRSVQILVDEKFISDSKVVHVGNIFHKDKFWTAQLNVSDLKSAELLFEKFAWNINHVSIRFNFAKPINLELQSSSKSNKKQIKLQESSIIFSAEAAPPENESYTLYDSFMGRYGLIYRAYSSEKYKDITQNLNHPVKVYPLKTTETETQALLLTSLIHANTSPIETYQLLFNNCATASIDLILNSKKLTLENGWNIWSIMDPLRGVPADKYLGIGTLRSLKWWDLIDDKDIPRPEKVRNT